MINWTRPSCSIMSGFTLGHYKSFVNGCNLVVFVFFSLVIICDSQKRGQVFVRRFEQKQNENVYAITSALTGIHTHFNSALHPISNEGKERNNL